MKQLQKGQVEIVLRKPYNGWYFFTFLALVLVIKLCCALCAVTLPQQLEGISTMTIHII